MKISCKHVISVNVEIVWGAGILAPGSSCCWGDTLLRQNSTVQTAAAIFKTRMDLVQNKTLLVHMLCCINQAVREGSTKTRIHCTEVV